MTPPEFTTAPIDWDGPWGGVAHIAADYGPGIEEADEQ